MMKTQDLFEEAVSLPPEIKAQLINKLLLSIHDIHQDIDQLWAVEAEKRVKDIKNKKVQPIPGDQVFKNLIIS
jgi:hypothetical protein